MIKVLKFGGTSMGNAARMRQVAEIVQQSPSALVVLSAMSGVTNSLVSLTEKIRNNDHSSALEELHSLQTKFKQVCYELFTDGLFLSDATEELNGHFESLNKHLNINGNEVDEKWLLSRGEIITSNIFFRLMASMGADVKLISALDFMQTNQEGEPVLENIGQKLLPLIQESNSSYHITQGYICLNYLGEIDNLNRGGSDYTATLTGAALNSPLIEIWTDIDGLHNNDPRMVEGTSPVRELSFDEASELAYFGAKILHPACVWPAQKMNIPILLKNTLEPHSEGTMINSYGKPGTLAIAAKSGIHIVKIRSGRMMNAYGFLKRVFEVFEKYRKPIDVITTSEISVSLTVDNPEHLYSVVAELSELGQVSTENQHAIICVVGDSLEHDFRQVSHIVQNLGNLPVKMISFGGGKNNITFVVQENHLKQALNHLQNTLFNHTPNNIIPCFCHNS
jgi:aspartate kinase